MRFGCLFDADFEAMICRCLLQRCLNNGKTGTTDRLYLARNSGTNGSHGTVSAIQRFIYVVECRPDIVSQLGVTKTHGTSILGFDTKTNQHRACHRGVLHKCLLIDIERIGDFGDFLIVHIRLLTERVAKLIFNTIPLRCHVDVFRHFLYQPCHGLYSTLNDRRKACQIERCGVDLSTQFVHRVRRGLSVRIDRLKARSNAGHFLRQRPELIVEFGDLGGKIRNGLVVKACRYLGKLGHTGYHGIQSARLHTGQGRHSICQPVRLGFYLAHIHRSHGFECLGQFGQAVGQAGNRADAL